MELEEAMEQEINAQESVEKGELDKEEPIAETGIQPVEEEEDDDTSQEELTEVDTNQVIAQLQEGNRQLYNQLMRSRADFENFKRRSQRDKEMQINSAVADVFRDLLGVMDNFDRAMSAVEDPQSSFAIGVKLIHKQFLDFLSQRGVNEIEAATKVFDPHLHEAMATYASLDHEENTVIDVYQKGYTLGEFLLRPAKVTVAMRPQQETDEEEDQVDPNATGE